jgi:hypothetical protein
MFGMTLMVMVIVLPILVAGLLLGGAVVFNQNQAHTQPTKITQIPIYRPTVNTSTSAGASARFCSHCGAGLQADWTHCPQCGAPI